MRMFLAIVMGGAVLLLAFWAYQENYRTRHALSEVRKVRSEISLLREELGVLRAEWAYLNRPERLRQLAELNFPKLGLLPMTPDQFGRLDQIGYPKPPELIPEDGGLNGEESDD
ncbi:cell division protein FtsL [Qingshengfaniella alkalisoli]|uniref:Cell division protein FtsL n=1 Tax=Qingshengfaniella alkalisoli TaxID=2599296 RepID=A0A5B8I7C7_9RHOB|nr:cell division protein FtsL [Qingshengfaniella alkalisoli]QDY69459.1 cell division protein FtsL [Qingshengfaniella alkalisoli]